MSAHRRLVPGTSTAPRRARPGPARRRLPRGLPPPRCGGRRSRLGQGAPGDFDELLKGARVLDRGVSEHLAIHPATPPPPAGTDGRWKGARVLDRNVSEHLAIPLDTRLLEAVHELVGRKAVLARCRVEARDP